MKTKSEINTKASTEKQADPPKEAKKGWFKRIPFKLIIVLMVAVAGYQFWNQAPAEISTGGQSQISITAEDIEKILEVAAASQKVYVTTDTLFVTKSIKTLFGVKLKFIDKAIETVENHRLKERRTWILKAGSKHFDLKPTETGYTLNVEAPQILTREHVAEEYQEIERTGVWNPVVLKQIEISSRNRAQNEAIKAGILVEAKLSLENSLLQILPTNVTIHIND
jgi:hypothetical protein